VKAWGSLRYAAAVEDADEATQAALAAVWNQNVCMKRAQHQRVAKGLKAMHDKQAQTKRPSDAAIRAKLDELRAYGGADASWRWQFAADYFTARGWPVSAKRLANLASELRRG
jgi:hypothetical protein